MFYVAGVITPEDSGIRYIYRLTSILILVLLCVSVRQTGAQEDLNRDILRYRADIQKNPNDTKAYRRLGIAYARKGMLNEAEDQFKRAIEIEYQRGYENGIDDGAKRIYGRYLILSIVAGLLIAALIVTILQWSEMSGRVRTIRRGKRIRNFVKGIKGELSPELRDRAAQIAQRKEKLRDAIYRETDSNLDGAASSVLPKLEDLSKQAALLIELQQNLSEYVKDIDPSKLDEMQSDCEEKLKNESDPEARRALEYQLEQVKNERAKYHKAHAKIRTCDAVLSGIAARISATSLDLMSVPSVLIKKQEFFEKVSTELDDEINLTRDAAETVMDESS